MGRRRGWIHLKRGMVGVVAAALLCLIGLRATWHRPELPSSTTGLARLPSRVISSPTDQALWEARRRCGEAISAVVQQLERLENWDPETFDAAPRNDWLPLLARDATGSLARARDAARRGIRLARTPDERYRAMLLLSRLECYAGHHKKELELARRLMDMSPRKEYSLLSLRRAAECNHLPEMAAAADQDLDQLRKVGALNLPLKPAHPASADSLPPGDKSAGPARRHAPPSPRPRLDGATPAPVRAVDGTALPVR